MDTSTAVSGDLMEAKQQRPYRLGLDLGTNSLGWFVVWLDRDGERWRPVDLGPGGIRVFPDGRDPQSGTSNAADRRNARSARRRRDRFADRYFGRRSELLNALVRHGLMPAEVSDRKALEELDPYELRAGALDKPLSAHHVGRAIFHLNQRRGFLSNRKVDTKDDDKGAITQAASKLGEAMQQEGSRTLGQFLWRRHQRRESVRARPHMQGAKASYDFYPTRALLEAEFNAIWKSQASHHPQMTEAAREEIAQIIFYQRPLRQPPVGKCTLDPATQPFADDPEGYRCPWAHPLAQRFRIYQEVRNLEVGETGQTRRKLTKEEGDAVALTLLQRKEAKFEALRTLLKLPAGARFNLESERRPALDGDETAARLSHKSLFGKSWRSLDMSRQTAIVDKLLNEPDEIELALWLKGKCELDAETAERIADASLPEGHCRLGLRAIKKLLPLMEGGLRYDEAAAAAGYDHAKRPTGEMLDRLPYYGQWLSDAVVGTGDARDTKEKQFGQFPNPTVHIGLGQLRRLVNSLIDELGPPAEIAIEFTRALRVSPEEKRRIQAEQRKNQDLNRKRVERMREALDNPHLDPSPRDLLKMRLWEELGPADDRHCPYTGEVIGIRRLLSEEVDIDHILPFKMTLDDSAANKTVCMRYANRYKRKQTPFEAFGSSPDAYRWEEIAARAAMLPKNKRWRFDPDAREQFEKRGGFLSRQLNETGWLARLAKQYLGAVTDPNAIWVVPGRLTAMIRGKWGLNSLLPDHNYAGVQEKAAEFTAATDDMEFSGVKNRADHRHHAIDGLVVALTDRSLLWRMANAYDEDREKIEIPTPWDKNRLRDDLKASLDRMTVSHKPDHGTRGKLHEDTAYGIVKEPEKEGGKHFVRRKPIETLSIKEIGNIRDIRLRELIQQHVAKAKAEGIDLKVALENFKIQDHNNPHIKHGVRNVRILVPEDPKFTISIHDRKSKKPYKAFAAGENLFVDIHETSDGRWHGEATTRFQSNQNDGKETPPRTTRAEHIMRIFKGDLIALNYKGLRTVMVVRQLEASNNRVKLAPHNETGNLQARHETDDNIDPFRWLIASYNTLKSLGAEKVRVDERGRVWRVKNAR